MDHLRKQGRYLGGTVAVGFKKRADGTLTADRDWSKRLAEMQALSDAGKSTRFIADAMKERGLNISHNTVYRCLTQRRKTDTMQAGA